MLEKNQMLKTEKERTLPYAWQPTLTQILEGIKIENEN